ncbi:MAG: DUF1553 domain-containing protein [Pirellulales bacterium]|nr:DUF1553 domain-containing protein [Pirellulales bacterium]
MKLILAAILCFLATFAYAVLAKAEEASVKGSTLSFAYDVLPILSDHCFNCHGPDEASRQADLRLDVREEALRTVGRVTPIVPGQPEGSELVRRIRAFDEDIVMPPRDALKPLSAVQKDMLERWIDEGAQYAGHWAFTPPVRLDPPVAGQSDWARDTIDHFILKRLETAGLQPSPAAGREIWLRRVTLDLTGLPPTLEELDNYMADQSPNAESHVVDRLLKSEAHAERMAMHWLDAARYADTNGYNNDEVRTMWPWRDWAIQAFHGGMPYDQFLIEQLAGDLLPEPTISQRVATGFNRNHVLTTEGGIIPEEYQAEYVADRVHTASTVFMGISMQCARCHDHKFDPITQRDFYRFAAYFNNIRDSLATYGSARMADPVLKVPSPEQQRELESLSARQKDLTAQLELCAARIDTNLAAWEVELAPDEIADLGAVGLMAHFGLDEIDGNKTPNSVDLSHSAMIHGSALLKAGVSGQALGCDGATYVDAGQVGSFDSEDPFSVAAWFKADSASSGAILSKMDEGNAYRGYDVLLMNGHAVSHLVHHWPDKALKVVTKHPISPNEWHHIVVAYDGTRQAAGLQLFIDGELQEVDIVTNNLLEGPLTTDKPFCIGRRNGSLPFDGLIDEVQIYSICLSAAEAAQLAQGGKLNRLPSILAIRPEERSDEQREQLKQFYKNQIDTESIEHGEELRAITKRVEVIDSVISVTMVMQEMTDRRKTNILIRGQYDQLGEEVMPGLPDSLVGDDEMPEETRLDLAHWLTDPAHPLTARVAVNRWWEMLFGTGLVETAEDFGVQGARPSHPELLDWLATELIRQNWDQRVILKMIVLSSTYRQSSDVTPELLDADPNNRLLSRGPRWRLPAEMVRDNALAISGLLYRQVGGPSVKPYQPAGLWEDVSDSRRDKYVADTGPNLYRRSMYTFWKRTCPPPSMSAFGAPDRETCTVRRARTNTPLQALVLLNDPTYVEAARAFAQRIIQHVPDDDGRLTFAFRSCVARLPDDRERDAAAELLIAARQRFSEEPDAAQQLLSVGSSNVDVKVEPTELAAWTSVASILFNMDESISKP